MNQTSFKTEQESFWSGSFGADYISRNNSADLLASNLNFFAKALHSVSQIQSCIEFGANIGMNLQALKLLFPKLEQHGIEINEQACNELTKILREENIFRGSILDYEAHQAFDLVFIKGVLIHINPTMLESVYQKLYQASKNYILLAEYYNPTPLMIPYRGHADRLFKRDFCGELLDLFPNLQLIDYGFIYKRDPIFPQDDITWFLLKKGS